MVVFKITYYGKSMCEWYLAIALLYAVNDFFERCIACEEYAQKHS